MVDSVSNKGLFGGDIVSACGNLIQGKTYIMDAWSYHSGTRAILDLLRHLLRDRGSAESERASGNHY
jgi:hypothetical protein